MTAVAEEAELRLSLLKGQVHRSEDVEFIMTQRDTAIRARLLALPSRVAWLVLGKRDFKEVYDLINAEVLSTLEMLVAYDPATFNQRNEHYLASLFPEQVAKTNGDTNGASDDAEASEGD